MDERRGVLGAYGEDFELFGIEMDEVLLSCSVRTGGPGEQMQ